MMHSPFALFHSAALDGGWSRSYSSPVDWAFATSIGQVRSVVEMAEQAIDTGRHAVLMMSYEAAPAFDPCLRVGQIDEFPLAFAAVFEHPDTVMVPFNSVEYSQPSFAFRPLVEQTDYNRALEVVRHHIEQGDTYQVNLTFPLESDFSGDPLECFHYMFRGQNPGFGVYLDMGQYVVSSLSPELFFQKRNDLIMARPMKGTARRGRFPVEDERLAAELGRCPKNQAENVMIVDLLRNDLGKIAVPGSVHVDRLFHVERYPTVHQMTSTITAMLRSEVTLWDTLAGLFPCGSVTGAPKVSTMDIIRQLETYPRRVYCGAIGWLAPQGEAVFNVPIRTLIHDTEKKSVRLHVGSGIVWDSSAADEYEECLIKMRFVNRSLPEFSLLESLLLEHSHFFLLHAHLDRLKASARFFDIPVEMDRVHHHLERLAGRLGRARYKVRLTVSQSGHIDIGSVPLCAQPRTVRSVTIHDVPVDPDDVFLFHKTTRRHIYREAAEAHPDYDDVLLVNTRGQITESCIANIVVQKRGRLFTPPQGDGLLAGTLRNHLVAKKIVVEQSLFPDDLMTADRLFLVNSVRRFMPIVLHYDV
ncbi:aminodeoxychorismate synthase component I [Desulfovibrio inopinatus]|uniref:aminodeoxychorismate synthase component I n=1 Tax=Desulfovibrio inopinatus TaxID=102109 RepID=UPI00041AE5BA|nr:aminodeoxychorismate synthase component I [Desulfovibrio inopinatus]